jgi:hypothetical protein
MTLPKHIEDRLSDVLNVKVVYYQTRSGTQEQQTVYYDPHTVDTFRRLLSILYSRHKIPDHMIGAHPDGSCLSLQWGGILFTVDDDRSAWLYDANIGKDWDWDVCVDLDSVARTISCVLQGKS